MSSALRNAETCPLVDSNTLLAIETLFREGPTDPWAAVLAGHLADLFVYSEAFRFTHPLPSMSMLSGADVPRLAAELVREDSEVAVSAVCTTSEPWVIVDRHVEPCIEKFRAWSEIHPRQLRAWVATHEEPWVRTLYEEQVPRQYVFDVGRLSDNQDLRKVAEDTGLARADVLYAFDNILRYPIYGELAGDDAYYLNHPLRDAFPLPTMKLKPAPVPHVPVSWSKPASKIALHSTLEEFVEILFGLRDQVRRFRISEPDFADRPDRKMVRGIAARVGLPARLKRVPEIAAVGGGVLASMSVISNVGPLAVLLGCAVSVSSAIWKGRVGRHAGRIRWLRWALEWGVEDQCRAE
jgi:hypothetical protein